MEHFETGSLVWCLAYWASKPEPRPMLVRKHSEGGLYAFSFTDGHNVYLIPEDVYGSREAAIEGVAAIKAAREAIFKAETKALVNDLLKEFGVKT